MTIISTRRLSLLAAGASLAILAAAAPAAAQESLWNGWYIGANAGGSWGDNDLKRQVQAGGGAVVSPPVDVVLIKSTTSHSNTNKTGFTGGIEGGYNWVSANNWLFGIEADWVALSTNSRDSHTFTGTDRTLIFPPNVITYTINQRVDTDWMVSIRPRLGYTSGPMAVLWHRRRRLRRPEVEARVLRHPQRGGRLLVDREELDQNGLDRRPGGRICVFDRNWQVKGERLYADFRQHPYHGL